MRVGGGPGEVRCEASCPLDLPECEVGADGACQVLHGPWLLAVELASMLLLAGLIAAYHLAKK